MCVFISRIIYSFTIEELSVWFVGSIYLIMALYIVIRAYLLGPTKPLDKQMIIPNISSGELARIVRGLHKSLSWMALYPMLAYRHILSKYNEYWSRLERLAKHNEKIAQLTNKLIGVLGIKQIVVFMDGKPEKTFGRTSSEKIVLKAAEVFTLILLALTPLIVRTEGITACISIWAIWIMAFLAVKIATEYRQLRRINRIFEQAGVTMDRSRILESSKMISQILKEIFATVENAIGHKVCISRIHDSQTGNIRAIQKK